MIGLPCLAWCSAATRRANSTSAGDGPGRPSLVVGTSAGAEDGPPPTEDGPSAAGDEALAAGDELGAIEDAGALTGEEARTEADEAGDGSGRGPEARRSSMDTATRNAPAGVPAVNQPQSVGSAWWRLAAREG